MPAFGLCQLYRCSQVGSCCFRLPFTQAGLDEVLDLAIGLGL
jgi:hypothetical protein